MFNKQLFTSVIFGFAVIAMPCIVRAQDEDDDFEEEVTCTNFTLESVDYTDYLIDDSGKVQADGAENSVGRILSSEENYKFKQAANTEELRPKVNIYAQLIDGTLRLSAKVGRKTFTKSVGRIDSVFFIKNRDDNSFDGLYSISTRGAIRSINLIATGNRRKPYAYSFTTWGEADFEGFCEFPMEEEDPGEDDESEDDEDAIEDFS